MKLIKMIGTFFMTMKNTFQTFSGQPFSRSPDLHPSNVIINKLARIQDYILKRFDPELCNQLQQMEIAPQIYGM